jgi:hypothetical protein
MAWNGSWNGLPDNPSLVGSAELWAVLSVQVVHELHRAVLLVISRSGMSSHWRLVICKRRFTL